jgi:hypothetical protein
VEALMELHVVPSWQPHDASPTCWCGPVNEQRLIDTGALWVHRLANDGPAKIPEDKDPGPKRGGWRVVEA